MKFGNEKRKKVDGQRCSRRGILKEAIGFHSYHNNVKEKIKIEIKRQKVVLSNKKEMTTI